METWLSRTGSSPSGRTLHLTTMQDTFQEDTPVNRVPTTEIQFINNIVGERLMPPCAPINEGGRQSLRAQWPPGSGYSRQPTTPQGGARGGESLGLPPFSLWLSTTPGHWPGAVTRALSCWGPLLFAVTRGFLFGNTPKTPESLTHRWTAEPLRGNTEAGVCLLGVPLLVPFGVLGPPLEDSWLTR